MEDKILQVAQKAISESIVKELTGYNKPLSNLTSQVIESNHAKLYSLINDEFNSLLDSDLFRDSLKSALNAKLAKTLVARMGGELEKQVNELKANPETRAKITLAISKVIEDNEA